MEFCDKKILVVGLGKAGLSVLTFLKNQSNVVISAYDFNVSLEKTTQIREIFSSIPLYSGELKDTLEAHKFDILVLSPGISKYRDEIIQFEKKGHSVIGDIEIFAQLIKNKKDKVIAITGSNGKSTVTELVGFLCRQNGLDTVVAGNIGLPVLDAYQSRKGKSADVWVLELSSFQLETLESLDIDVATCLNVSEDHLDRYQNLLDYAHTKAKIFNRAKIQVLNADDVLCSAMKIEGSQTIWFSTEKQTDYWLKKENEHSLLMKNEEFFISYDQLSLQGLHNVKNILASIALCESIGLNKIQLISVLPYFKGLPHRVEKVGEISGISFIDDSKGTNVGATCAALLGMEHNIILIAGGLGKGQDFTPLKNAIESKVSHLFLIGQDASSIGSLFINSKIEPIYCKSLEEATRKAFFIAKENDWIMLSPACASMDMFRDYAHRSQVFIQTYEELKNETIS